MLCVYYAMHKVVQGDHVPVIADIFVKMPCILFPYYRLHNGLENGGKKPQPQKTRHYCSIFFFFTDVIRQVRCELDILHGKKNL